MKKIKASTVPLTENINASDTLLLLQEGALKGVRYDLLPFNALEKHMYASSSSGYCVIDLLAKKGNNMFYFIKAEVSRSSAGKPFLIYASFYNSTGGITDINFASNFYNEQNNVYVYYNSAGNICLAFSGIVSYSFVYVSAYRNRSGLIDFNVSLSQTKPTMTDSVTLL